MDSNDLLDKKIAAITRELEAIKDGQKRARGRRVRRLFDQLVELSARSSAARANELHRDLQEIAAFGSSIDRALQCE